VLGGGFPSGRLIELYGPEGSAKSLLTYMLMAHVQKAGSRCVLFDQEYSWNPLIAEACGCDVSEKSKNPILMPDTLSLEDLFEQALFLLKQIKNERDKLKAPPIFIWDSYAATSTRKQLESNEHKPDFGLKPRSMSENLRTVGRLVRDAQACFVIVNQVRANIGVMFGDKDTSPGGKALRHHCSMRLKLDAWGMDERDKKTKWPKVRKGRLKVIKTRLTPPHRTCNFIVPFGKPIHKFSGLWDLGEKLGLFKKVTAQKYSFENTEFTRRTFHKRVVEGTNFLSTLQEAVNTHV